MRRSPDIVVIGSGLAGMTAAVYLSEAGHKVCVLEANPFIGGRTASWIDKGMAIESGFHRFLGFYTALPEVLSKVGIDLDEMLCWEDEIEIRLPGGDAAVFGLAPLHKPAKTIAAALGNNDFLSPADKASAVRMFAAGAKDYVARPEELDSVAVLDYARDHGVTKQAVERLLTPLTEGIFFMPVDRYSMYNLMGLFMPYLKSMHKLRVGAFTGGMTEVMMQPMADYVVARGGEIHTNAPVDRLYIKKDEVCGAFAAGKKFCAKRVVLAASLAGAQKILKRSILEHLYIQDMLHMPSMPAVTFQIELTEPSMAIDRTTFGPGTALTSFTEQSRTTFSASKGRLSIILSPPERFIDLSDDQILEVVLKDAKKLGLQLEGKIVSYRSVRLPADFYSLAAGSEALRPPQDIGIPNLVLAGDYTKQPYLATMEGAVVSGKLAADLLMKNIV